MVKLVATDMDGTFLTSKGYYDNQRLHNVLEKFEKNDMLFVAASGRSMLALEKMFAPHADKMAFIAENGTLVKVGEKTVFESGLTKPQFLEITDTLIESPYMTGYDFLLSGEKGAYLHPKASDEYLEFISHYYENVQRVDNLANVTDNILKVTANFAEDTVRKGEAWFNQRIDFVKAVTTGFKSIDIILSDVNKRTGLEALCDSYGLSAAEVVAFGDNLNDYEMLEFAGRAVATQNARQEIKEISSEIIGHCNEESVMAYMEGLVD
ncbi:Cof-type HAD-IIB family hydrolase [Streptococcus equinus]|uniref:Cof-type HAD-IIB family hydrolase n=1 Tax=Streptococcus equinus TaxID=1335 RepID=UPI00195DC7D1|nr:Cof-type HAD-IIB family hydrolase [Streptococcus equinus]